ncbi:unnamed protein product [Heterobilharzia americana]|nr:unnamed protein product [Heterobilharzia americana]
MNKIQKKEKKPILCIKKRQIVLSAIDVQKLLGLTFFPQHFVKWPDWCSIIKPSLIKNVVLIFVSRVHTVNLGEEHEQSFTSIFGKPLKLLSPEAYKYTWDKEIAMIPRIFLTSHAAAMTDLQKSVFTPASRVWIADAKKIETNRLLKAVCNITKEEPPPDSLPELQKSTSTKRKPDSFFTLPPPGTPDAYDRTMLILSVEQMKTEKIPLPSELEVKLKQQKDRSDFVPSKPLFLPVSASSPMYAVDCEMVLTKAGSELARVTLVDESGKVVFDRLVKPPNPVEDYLTRFSGITRDMLASIDTTLADVQKELNEVLPGDAILVGHSIGNDLEAMKVFHPYLIDTSVIYNMKGSRSAKARLRFLAEHFLGRMIQTGKGGHSSAEDAIATMDLVRLKLSRGIEFGDVTTSWRFPEDYNSHLYVKSTRVSEPNKNHSRGRLDKINTTTVLNSNQAIESQRSIHTLTDMHYLKVHIAFQDHVLKLCSLYKSTGSPIHLFDRLLHDSGISYAYWPVYGCVNEEQEEKKEDEIMDIAENDALDSLNSDSLNATNTSIIAIDDDNDNNTDKRNNSSINNNHVNGETISKSSIENKISKQFLNYILDLCNSKRLVMAKANCSPEWDETKCYRKVAKFCTKLYSSLSENSLIGVVCTGCDFKQKPITKTKLSVNKMLKLAQRDFYVTLTSNSKTTDADVDENNQI